MRYVCGFGWLWRRWCVGVVGWLLGVSSLMGCRRVQGWLGLLVLCSWGLLVVGGWWWCVGWLVMMVL